MKKAYNLQNYSITVFTWESTTVQLDGPLIYAVEHLVVRLSTALVPLLPLHYIDAYVFKTL